MSKLKVLHQCGHNTVWNLKSYIDEGIGDGLIFSPSDFEKEKIERLNIEIKQKSLFDPQFYLPHSDKKKFETYDFFPNTFMDSAYSTEDYEEIAFEDAYKCVEFQKNNKFSDIIIPCVYKDNFTEQYLEAQKDLYVMPFLSAIEKLGISGNIFLTIILKDNYLYDENIKKDLLSFATSFQSIDGIYIIPEHSETYKRIRDERYLFELMKFIDKLRDNELLVHLGYTDIEGFILSLSGLTSISIGTYENTRCFNIDKFKKNDGQRQGPNPRVFSSKLLQNVEYTYLASLETLYDKYNELFEEDEYKIKMFNPTYSWHFSKPEIYKYYLCHYTKLLKALPENYDEEYNFILEKINESMIYYKEIEESGVLFDEKSNGDHLIHWKNAITMFNKYKLNK